MDERAAQLEPANDQDISIMSEHVKESLNAGEEKLNSCDEYEKKFYLSQVY